MGREASSSVPGVGLSASQPLVAVVADRGAGKTTLLRSWEEQLRRAGERPSIWLDPARVAEDPRLLGRLEELRDESESHCVLIDDVVQLIGGVSWDDLLTVAGRGPHQLVVASRPVPDLPLHLWRASGRLTEIGSTDLRLGADAVERLAEERGVTIGPAVVERVLDLTEGLADGVVSALDRLAESTAPGVQLELVESAIADYALGLADHIESTVGANEFQFLTRTSLLDRIDGELGAAVDGATLDGNSPPHRDLASLLRVTPFTEPVDGRGGEIRVHRLARRGLRLRLEQRERPPEIAARHLAAARRLSDTGQFETAIDHYLAAGQPERAADALAAMLPGQFSDEDVQRVSQAGAADYVPHLVTVAESLLRADEFAAALLIRNRLAASEWEGPLPHGYGSLDLAVAELDGRLPELTAGHLERYVASWGREPSNGDGPRDLATQYTAAHYCYWLGRPDEVTDRVASILLGHRSVGRHRPIDKVVTVLACDLGALAHRDLGAAHVAERHWRRANELLTSYGIDDLGSISNQPLEVHRLAEAVVDDQPPEQRLERLAWLVEEAQSAEVRLHAGFETVRLLDGLNRFAEALDALAALEARVDERELPPVPLHVARLFALQQALRPGRDSSGPAMHITDGERAVLYLLTDDALSQNEIAERLDLSINTVKSHLRSIYQKLGVTGRREAVAEARARHLLITVDPWVVPD